MCAWGVNWWLAEDCQLINNFEHAQFAWMTLKVCRRIKLFQLYIRRGCVYAVEGVSFLAYDHGLTQADSLARHNNLYSQWRQRNSPSCRKPSRHTQVPEVFAPLPPFTDSSIHQLLSIASWQSTSVLQTSPSSPSSQQNNTFFDKIVWYDHQIIINK